MNMSFPGEATINSVQVMQLASQVTLGEFFLLFFLASLFLSTNERILIFRILGYLDRILLLLWLLDQ